MRAAVTEDGIPLNVFYARPGENDSDAWRRMKLAASSHYAAALKDRGLLGSVGLETTRIGSATVHFARPSELMLEDCVHLDLRGAAFDFGSI